MNPKVNFTYRSLKKRPTKSGPFNELLLTILVVMGATEMYP
jgi:hypothetical protein